MRWVGRLRSYPSVCTCAACGAACTRGVFRRVRDGSVRASRKGKKIYCFIHFEVSTGDPAPSFISPRLPERRGRLDRIGSNPPSANALAKSAHQIRRHWACEASFAICPRAICPLLACALLY